MSMDAVQTGPFPWLAKKALSQIIPTCILSPLSGSEALSQGVFVKAGPSFSVVIFFRILLTPDFTRGEPHVAIISLVETTCVLVCVCALAEPPPPPPQKIDF